MTAAFRARWRCEYSRWASRRHATRRHMVRAGPFRDLDVVRPQKRQCGSEVVVTRYATICSGIAQGGSQTVVRRKGLDRQTPAPIFQSMAPVSPIKQSPLNLLRNAVDVCVCYEDTKNVAPESAQQQLGRIRGLIMQALAGLGEPTRETMNVTQMFLDMVPLPTGADYDRFVRDAAAAITHTALTWGIGDNL